MSITLYAKLDMTPGAVPTVVHRSQYDSDFTLVFSLYTRTGDFVIASGTTARMRGTKTSGTGYSIPVTLDVSAKTVTVTGDQQMTAAAGSNIFEIVLYQGDLEICSSNFILQVERAALDMDTITDDTVIRELDNLDQFIKEAEAAADRAEDAAATFSVDATLTVSGKAADAKKTGDELAKKIDAVSGKGLSTEDYSSAEKEKLAGIEAEANKTTIDSTLTVTGNAADAKAVGDAIASEDKKALTAFAIDTASGSIAHFEDGADNIPMKDVLIHIEPVQAGSGDPSPDNVRPITGWTLAKVTRTGKNLYDFADISIEANVQKNIDFSEYIDLKAGTYTLSYTLDKTVTATRNRPAYTTTNNKYIYGDPDIKTAGRGSWTFTLASNTTLKFFWWNHTVSEACTIGGIQLELGSTATDYEPYSGQTYDIAFPSEAGTVYGGTLDVTNGVLIVDRAIIASYAGETLPSTWISDRDVYSEGATPTTGAQVCYYLATPITYHLTPQEITSLLGTNNLWVDTGDIDVEYRADTKVYVDAKVAAEESDITALQNSKVDMTTPLLNFDDTATDPLTDDGALANALTALGILSDVMPAGGGSLYLKKALTEYGKKVRKLASNNPRFSIKYITITNFRIPDGTQSSPATVTIDLGEYGITDSIWSATVYIGSYLLPYIDTSTGAQRTWVSKISFRSVTITNTTSGWGNATLYLFVISNGTTV